MAFSLGKTTLLFVLALLLALAYADVLDEDVDVEEMDLAVRQEEDDGTDVAPGDPEAEADAPPGRGPLFAAPASPPSRVCGVFILCERTSSGGPSAALIQGEEGTFRVRTKGRCKNFRVAGKCGKKTRLNHAKLWPVGGEEFDELCFYKETKHACFTGTVQVIKRLNGVTTVEYECTPAFDAHTVRFCMYRNPNLC